MSHKFKGHNKGIIYFILMIIQFSMCSIEGGEEISVLENNVTYAKFGEYCLTKVCHGNQFCDEDFLCQCLPGYKVLSNDCVPLAGENEKCTRQEDCNGKLICINGICRKPVLSDEFATLAKICLGITITTIIIAAFSSLLKCLIRYDNSRAIQRQSVASSLNSTQTFNRNISPRPTFFEVQEEKPPSYDECIRSAEPPPYTVSTNPTTLVGGSQLMNLSTANLQTETPFSIQNLNPKMNSQLH